MRVVITQSNYIPWKGYFDLCRDADTFVFLDNIQFTTRDWRTRNRIKTPHGIKWLSIPVGNDRNRLISEVKLPEAWAEDHWKTIRQNYGKSPYFAEYREFFENIYLGRRWSSLSELNQHMIRSIAQDILGIRINFRNASEFDVTSKKQDLILDLLKSCGATSYVSGPAAKAYIEPERFKSLGIELIWKDYSGYPEYTQPYPPFEHAVSILDTIFCCGKDSPNFIWGWRENEKWSSSEQKKTLSIVVPVYQNELNLHRTIPALLDLRNDLQGYRLELVFVNDGSSDRSLEILLEYSKSNPEIKVVSLTRNFGQTPATQAGLRFASGDCAVVVSCDLQEPVGKIAEMVRAWESGAKYVIGERVKRAEGWRHRTTSSLYWKIVRWYAFKDFPSMGYDFCLLDRQVIQDVISINEKNSSIFVLIYWFGYRPLRIPIERDVRREGKSQWKIANKIRFTVDTLIGFTYLPSRFITYTGFISAFLAVAYLVFMFVYWALHREAPQGWMTVVSLVVIFGSLILVSLGILSEYLLRILDETRKRPLYVVDRVISMNANTISKEIEYGQ